MFLFLNSTFSPIGTPWGGFVPIHCVQRWERLWGRWVAGQRKCLSPVYVKMSCCKVTTGYLEGWKSKFYCVIEGCFDSLFTLLHYVHFWFVSVYFFLWNNKLMFGVWSNCSDVFFFCDILYQLLRILFYMYKYGSFGCLVIYFYLIRFIDFIIFTKCVFVSIKACIIIVNNS